MLPRFQILLVLLTLIFHQTLSLSSKYAPIRTPKKQLQQQQQQDVPSSSTTLKSIAFRAASRHPGSKRYLSEWRKYSQLAIELIRHELVQHLPHPINKTATDQLTWALGHAADDGLMPSFSDAGARAGYAVGLLQSRSRMIADLLQGDVWNTTVEQQDNRDWNMSNQFRHANNNCNLLSIGGGPGYDFLGAALVASFHNELAAFAAKAQPGSNKNKNQTKTTFQNNNLKIRATVYDYESDWMDLVDTMAQVTHSILPNHNNYHCEFGGRCDITLPLVSSNINHGIFKAAPTTNIFVCQYCVAENAAELRRNKFVFFRNLLNLAPQGAILVFTETTHRLWPELVDAIITNTNDNDNDGFEISFPFPKRGRNGVCLFVRKRQGGAADTTSLSDKQYLKETCQEFALHQEMNERRQQNGFVRQQKKKK